MTQQDVQIKSRFNLAVRKLSGVSTFIAYAEAIRGMGYNRGSVSRGFFTLVQKGDYLPGESEVLCEWLQGSSLFSNGASVALLPNKNGGSENAIGVVSQV